MSHLIAVASVVLAASVPPPEPRTYDLYDWSAVAPVVLAGESLGDDGKWHEFRVQELLRGTSTAAGSVIRVALQRANRDRDRSSQRFALHFSEGASYLLLLEPAKLEQSDGTPGFDLVRGLLGVRELPAEGRPAVLGALRELIEVQDLASDPQTWQRMGELLDETNPILLETALGQFLKFQRAEPAHLASLRPLLDHPRPELRERAARVIAQVLRDNAPSAIPDSPLLRAELISRARRDGEVAVRLAATAALDRFDDEAVVDVLEDIAKSDPDQNVRYTAEMLIYERRHRRGAGEGVRN